MGDPTLAEQVKDWATSVAIVVGGGWALWRFGHTEWLRRRAEIPSLEGGSTAPEACVFLDGRAVVSLRWIWRNTGSRPVYINDKESVVEVYRLQGDVGTFVDPRQQSEALEPFRIGTHLPLAGFGWYRFEPNTTSSIMTAIILPPGEAFIARNQLIADNKYHPTGADWSYSWERWIVFRTDVPARPIGTKARSQ
jgi:hypothetical protein